MIPKWNSLWSNHDYIARIVIAVSYISACHFFNRGKKNSHFPIQTHLWKMIWIRMKLLLLHIGTLLLLAHWMGFDDVNSIHITVFIETCHLNKQLLYHWNQQNCLCRYRRWKLGDDIDLIVRCEHDGVMIGANGEVSFINIKTLNEWDSRVRKNKSGSAYWLRYWSKQKEICVYIHVYTLIIWLYWLYEKSIT